MTDKMRDEFEKWWYENYKFQVDREEEGYSLERFESAPNQYIETRPHHDWRVWKASRAALDSLAEQAQQLNMGYEEDK